MRRPSQGHIVTDGLIKRDLFGKKQSKAGGKEAADARSAEMRGNHEGFPFTYMRIRTAYNKRPIKEENGL